MLLAETDIALLIPLITSSIVTILGTIAALLAAFRAKPAAETLNHIREMGPKVTAIDNAVNGQPPGTEFLVDKVAGIKDEQALVRQELGERQETHPRSNGL